MTVAVETALAAVSRSFGVDLSITEGGIEIDGSALELPVLTGERDDLFGIEGLFPTVARGDDRDKILWQVVAKSGPDPSGTRLSDRDLEQDLTTLLDLGDETPAAVSSVLLERFFNHKKVKALLPVHSSLPLNYRHVGMTGRDLGYRMFSGEILPFMLWRTADGPDTELIGRLLELLQSTDELTALDRKLLTVAMDGAPQRDATTSADGLVARYADGLQEQFELSGGPFCEASLATFRRDLATVLDTQMPRQDKIRWITLLLSLHLTIRLYRMSWVLGGTLDLAVAAAGELPPPPGASACACTGEPGCLAACPLAEKIRFRIGTGAYRPITQHDPCRTSYVDLDQRRLLDLPATLVTRSLASRAWSALGGGESARRRDLGALTRALLSDGELRRKFDAACAAMAIIHHHQWRAHASEFELAEVARTSRGRPGLHALRKDVRLMRRRDLRHQSRDIVNQLMLDRNVAGPGSLVTRNGTIGFFEVDEELLLLLVRLICRDDQIAYGVFLAGLAEYGLAPQSLAERDALAASLERLGLLIRYSDSGEAAFVHHA